MDGIGVNLGRSQEQSSLEPILFVVFETHKRLVVHSHFLGRFNSLGGILLLEELKQVILINSHETHCLLLLPVGIRTLVDWF